MAARASPRMPVGPHGAASGHGARRASYPRTSTRFSGSFMRGAVLSTARRGGGKGGTTRTPSRWKMRSRRPGAVCAAGDTHATGKVQPASPAIGGRPSPLLRTRGPSPSRRLAEGGHDLALARAVRACAARGALKHHRLRSCALVARLRRAQTADPASGLRHTCAACRGRILLQVLQLLDDALRGHGGVTRRGPAHAQWHVATSCRTLQTTTTSKTRDQTTDFLARCGFDVFVFARQRAHRAARWETAWGTISVHVFVYCTAS